MIERMKGWIDNFAADVAIVQKVVESSQAHKEARKLCAGALGYLVKQMDLIPDWEPICGLLDDAMVLRVAVSLASDGDLGTLDAETTRGVGRLANDADLVAELLGPDLYARFKRYTQQLVRTEVRGRVPEVVVGDPKAREQLWREISDELRKPRAKEITDPERLERMIKSYFEKKLPR